jgi:hypothetical protein
MLSTIKSVNGCVLQGSEREEDDSGLHPIRASAIRKIFCVKI